MLIYLKKIIKFSGIELLGHIYFDWEGPRDSVTEYGKKLEATCKKRGIKFMGVWSPYQDRWNFVAMIEARTMDDILGSFADAGAMPKEMKHSIIKYFGRDYHAEA
jgi:hypothetical protein